MTVKRYVLEAGTGKAAADLDAMTEAERGRILERVFTGAAHRLGYSEPQGRRRSEGIAAISSNAQNPVE